MNWYAWQGTDLSLHLALQPNAKRSEWMGLHGERIKLRLQAPPVDGRANAMLVEFLGDEFGVPRTRVTITHGLASRQKSVRILGPVIVPQALHELGLRLPSSR